MKTFLLTVVFYLIASPANAARTDAYIDAGWKIIFNIKGDLNKDGREDQIWVIDAPESLTEPDNSCNPESDYSDAPVRRLIVEFAQAGGDFETVVDDEKVLLRSDQGGMMGDPLEEISIERGSMVVHYFGGSRERWIFTQRFRWQENDFKLIGYEHSTVDSVSNSIVSYDYNALTSKLLLSVEESPDEELRLTEPVCVACRNVEKCPEYNGCYEGTKRTASGETWFKVETRQLVSIGNFRCWEEEVGLLKHTGFQDD